MQFVRKIGFSPNVIQDFYGYLWMGQSASMMKFNLTQNDTFVFKELTYIW